MKYITAVIAVLSVSMVKADALLFPYVVTSPTVATIVSVVNKDTSGRLFLEYFTKITLDHDSECVSSGEKLVGSAQNDVVSFEVNGKFEGPDPLTVGGPLFNDPGVNADYTGDDFTMERPGEVTRGYLIVDDDDNDGEDLYGEAMILETAGGAAWGYIAFNAANDSFNSPTFDSDASSPAGVVNDVHGEALDEGNNTDNAPFTALPLNEWVTKFFVTPLGDSNQRLCADCSVKVEVTRNGGGTSPGMYDRDATPLSGNNPVNVVCVSGVGLDELLPASVEAVVAVQGGYGFIDIDTGDASTAQGTTGNRENAATVIKLEFNKAGTQSISPSPANSFVGTVNTAVWLMNRENAEGNDAF